MNKLPSLLIAFSLLVCVSYAQLGPKPTAASLKYHAYRCESTDPAVPTARVKSLIKHIKPDQDDNRALADKVYNSLTVDEKFAYAMLHGEDFSQNCNEMSVLADEQKKIFAYPPGAFGDEAVWSERQRKFLKDNRSQVISLLRSTMKKKHRAGVNLKQAIVELNAVELIPDLVSLYKSQRKDHDILTVLMLLMKEGRFKPFMESASYKKLYGDDSNYQAYLVANTANQDLVMERALAFHKNRVR